jgi:hypothetical protein
MFKRIKNLLDISRYTVEELKNPSVYTMGNVPLKNVPHGYISVDTKQPSPHYAISNVDSSSGMAKIINMQDEDPFKDFTNETTEQTPDDTTPRN